jgi:Xaa-Pro aminopeptidase
MNSANNSNSNEKALEVRTHDIPIADAMTEFMKDRLGAITTYWG